MKQMHKWFQICMRSHAFICVFFEKMTKLQPKKPRYSIIRVDASNKLSCSVHFQCHQRPDIFIENFKKYNLLDTSNYSIQIGKVSAIMLWPTNVLAAECHVAHLYSHQFANKKFILHFSRIDLVRFVMVSFFFK